VAEGKQTELRAHRDSGALRLPRSLQAGGGIVVEDAEHTM